MAISPMGNSGTGLRGAALSQCGDQLTTTEKHRNQGMTEDSRMACQAGALQSTRGIRHGNYQALLVRRWFQPERLHT